MLKPPKHWVGDGFNVYPVFANKAFTNDLSPFLMFDYGAPKHFPPTKKRLGVGQHPHRGFETVTVAFQGEVEHADNKGNRGIIGPGDVQWMTAGKGIIHEEFHSTSFANTGGVLEMCQLWVNLPSTKKMTKPRYQAILADTITSAALVATPLQHNTESAPTSAAASVAAASDVSSSTETDGIVRIIAGNFGDVKGPALTFTPVTVLDVSVQNTTKSFDFAFPESYNVIVFVRDGGVQIGNKVLGPQDVAVMNRSGSILTLKATSPATKILVLAGEPLNEPIVQHGPMCMNTQKEIQQAMSDFQNGKF